MDHVAIMKPSWHLIEKIISGEKTIESRRYQTRRSPWDKVTAGDVVYFKNAGQQVTAKAMIGRVMQFEISKVEDIVPILDKYAKSICLQSTNPYTWSSVPKYCILMWLENPVAIRPFSIDKHGYGSAAAWITIDDIDAIKI